MGWPLDHHLQLASHSAFVANPAGAARQAGGFCHLSHPHMLPAAGVGAGGAGEGARGAGGGGGVGDARKEPGYKKRYRESCCSTSTVNLALEVEMF